MKALMLCESFPLQYHVLRCVAAAGYDVVVLGSPESRHLGFSRYCKHFRRCDLAFEPANKIELVVLINSLVAQYGIDIIFAADSATTRFLSLNHDLIDAACFPTPEPGILAVLDNKADFSALCTELGISHPPTQLYATRDALIRGMAEREIKHPFIAKPVVGWGAGMGVKLIGQRKDDENVTDIDYEPILVQQRVLGDDHVVGVSCERGLIKKFVSYRKKNGEVLFLFNELAFEFTKRIANYAELSGVFCFDFIVSDTDNEVFFIECNPRFWFTMDIVMVAGLNFATVEQNNAEETPFLTIPDGTRALLPRALARAMARPWRWRRADFRMLAYLLADPVPGLMRQLTRAIGKIARHGARHPFGPRRLRPRLDELPAGPSLPPRRF